MSYTITRAVTPRLSDAIADAEVGRAPTQNAVYDALALKADATGSSAGVAQLSDVSAFATYAPASYAAAPPIVEVGYNYVAGDGGGTFYKASSGTADGGCTFATATSGVYYIRQRPDGRADAAWYGMNASRTAAQNNTAFAAVLALLIADGGGWLYLPTSTNAAPISVSATLDVTSADNIQIVGCGFGTNGELGTILKWSGSGSAMISANPSSGQLTGFGMHNLCLDGNSLATYCISLAGHTSNQFKSVLCRNAITAQIYETTSTSGQGPQLNLWEDMDVQAASTAKGWHWDSTSTDANINFNNYNSIRITHVDGTGWDAGNADSNTIRGLLIQRATGSGSGIICQASASSNLRRNRANTWLGVQSTGEIRIKNGTFPSSGNMFYLISESGGATLTIEAGATARSTNENGLQVGQYRFDANGIQIKDAGGSFKSTVTMASTLTADRTLTIKQGDAAQTLDLLNTSFTPTFTCATPGDLSVSYATQIGRYQQIGKLVFYKLNLVCTPTWTTATGEPRISGLPFTSDNDGATTAASKAVLAAVGTPASWVEFWMRVEVNATYLRGRFLTSAGAGSAWDMTHMTSGVAITVNVAGHYWMA